MKNKLKKVLMPCFLSIICGTICGKLVFGVYDKKIEDDIYGEKVYLIQAGEFSDYDKMVTNTSLSKYVYYQDEDGIFKSIIGFTEDYNNIEKIKNIYPHEVVVSEYYSNDLELNKKIKEFDTKISQTSNQDEIQGIVLEMLGLYKENDSTLRSIAVE